MKKLSLHPACKLFPQLPKDELRALAADIKAIGIDKEKKYLATAKRRITRG